MRWAALIAFATGLAGAACSKSTPATEHAPLPDDVGDAGPEPGDPLVGCRGIHRDETTDDLACAKVKLSVNRAPEGDLDALLDQYVKANHGDADHKVEPWGFDDSDTRARRVILGPGSALESREHIVVGRRNGTTRFVVCLALDRMSPVEEIDRSCRRIAVASLSGVPQRLFRDAEPVGDKADRQRFVGQEVPVPDGCQLVGGQANITCGAGGQVSWVEERYSPRPVAEVHAEQVATLPKQIAGIGGTITKPEERPCRVGGEPARCTRYVYTIKLTDTVVIYALGKVRNQPVLVACSWERGLESGGDPPQPCNALLSN